MRRLDILHAHAADDDAQREGHDGLVFWQGKTSPQQARRITDAVESLAEDQQEDDAERLIWWCYHDDWLYFRKTESAVGRVMTGRQLRSLMEQAKMLVTRHPCHERAGQGQGGGRAGL